MGRRDIVVTDRIRIPKAMIPAKAIKSRYEITLYQEEKCAKCDNLPDRAPTNDLCVECPSFGGHFRFFNAKEAREGRVWSVPQADEHALRRFLRKRDIDFNWVDTREKIPMEHKLKFTGRLFREGDVDPDGNPRPDQLSAVKQWWKKKVGILVAKPRSGKTVMATYLTCKLGVKTVIIASQKEWLGQFYETMVGKRPPRYLRKTIVRDSGTVGRGCVTNIPELQEETGKEVVFMPQSFAALKRFMDDTGEVPDILLITYQSFRKDDKRIADIINKHYSFCVVDEEHSVGATEYLRFASKLNMLWRLGLSATPGRKDGKCLRFDTLISMHDGSTKRIGDIREGDRVKTPKGVGGVVLNTETSRKLAFKIELSDGRSVICSADHRFPTQRGLVRCADLTRADEILVSKI